MPPDSNNGEKDDQLPIIDDQIDAPLQEQSPTSHWLHQIVETAGAMKASTVYFTPQEDGTLEIHFQNEEEILAYPGGVVPRMLRPILTSKLKKLARLEIAEKRAAQQGSFEMMLEGRTLTKWDLFVEPTNPGEKLTVQIHYREEK